jgi:hypothetical protein
MSRLGVLACVLILVGAVTAGCGDGYRGTVRQEAKQLLGNGDPTILRLDQVHDLGGNLQVVATLHGDFTMPPSHGCLRGPCGPAPPVHYVWLSFSDPRGMTGLQVTSAKEIVAIDHAHAASEVFGIFPHSPSAIRCDIEPNGGSGTIAGSCSTQAMGTPLTRITEVMFRERWPFRAVRDGSWPHQQAGGWIVTLDRHERVRSIHRFGDLPPQLAK